MAEIAQPMDIERAAAEIAVAFAVFKEQDDTPLARWLEYRAYCELIDLLQSTNELPQGYNLFPIDPAALREWLVRGSKGKFARDANECDKNPTRESCSGLGIARSTFYAWRKRPPSRRATVDAILLKEIDRIYQETGETYGSPRMHDDLRELGCRIGRKRVERLMRLRRLRARQFRRRRMPGSRRASVLAPNLVRRRFTVDRLNTVWVGDITELWTAEGKLYVAAVIDLCSRRMAGWTSSDAALL